MVVIENVREGTVAFRAGIMPGDELISINGHEIFDILDYRFRLCERRVRLELRRGARHFAVSFNKSEEQTDIGLDFATALMDDKQSCRNKCIFCFIDQNPEGMRESCYFKDDDSRLSFLHGNYITLTNISEREVERIIEMHISPINVSVHTTNPTLRCMMLNNRFAGQTLSYLRRFADAGITICAQIVLCRGINDGSELDRTLHDLMEYLPALDSVSIVPAGLTRHREGLYPLTSYSPEECRAVIKQVDAYGDFCCAKYGRRIFFCSDEFYVKGEVELPGEEHYGDFSQIEDGVGMLTSFLSEAMRELEYITPKADNNHKRTLTVITGAAAYSTIKKIVDKVTEKRGDISVNVKAIRNDFFGESVTVSGLITGSDIIAQCRELALGECILIPRNCLRADGDLFLDNLSPATVSEALGTPVITTPCDGGEFVRALCLGKRYKPLY